MRFWRYFGAVNELGEVSGCYIRGLSQNEPRKRILDPREESPVSALSPVRQIN